MSTMIPLDDLISAAADKAGLTPEQARAALVSALGLLEKHAEPEAMAAVYAAVSGAREAALSDEAKPPRGGLMGGLMKSAGGLSGKAIADAMAVLGRLEKVGVGRDELKRLLPAARNRLRTVTGADPLGEAVKTVPGVGALLGG
ncbi:hypothetical protein KOAAANKH_03865 [Brevundimonas sp. NIBR10]|uniref:hypothetical protein n=1 Tax=Brevundimonas sp. NIBR10 TaxID=3015997 RepID=UPI0022F176A4|nr:hypothetical protein [Brevundimonas sp. NIBR10]WGM48950.1 hypothetical protein KOAAANKH_03865 [Brevundimonas sp. NIBR10]